MGFFSRHHWRRILRYLPILWLHTRVLRCTNSRHIIAFEAIIGVRIASICWLAQREFANRHVWIVLFVISRVRIRLPYQIGTQILLRLHIKPVAIRLPSDIVILILGIPLPLFLLVVEPVLINVLIVCALSRNFLNHLQLVEVLVLMQGSRSRMKRYGHYRHRVTMRWADWEASVVEGRWVLGFAVKTVIHLKILLALSRGHRSQPHDRRGCQRSLERVWAARNLVDLFHISLGLDLVIESIIKFNLILVLGVLIGWLVVTVTLQLVGIVLLIR